MVIMSRSQDKLQLVADEISELIGSAFTLSYFSTSPPFLSTPIHTHLLFLPISPTEEKYGREVRIIPVDFSGGSEIYPQIAENLQDLEIGVLGEGLASPDEGCVSDIHLSPPSPTPCPPPPPPPPPPRHTHTHTHLTSPVSHGLW